MNKMTLEEFRKIKARMNEIFHMGEDGTKFTEEQEQALVKELYAMIDTLLNSDLSDIPFEEWEGMSLFSEGELDLSKTHANIDFSLLEEFGCEKIKFDGCNVRGLWRIDYDETTFDQEFMEQHPELFPDKSIPKDVRDRYYSHQIIFRDIFEYPLLRKCINPNSFGRYYVSCSSELVNRIGFENAMRLYDENPRLISLATDDSHKHSISMHNSHIVFYNVPEFKKGGSYEEARDYFFMLIFKTIKNRYLFDFPPFELIPKDIIDKNPEFFVEDLDLPLEVKAKYYKGSLSINEIRYYYELLKGKDLNIGISSNYDITRILRVFDSIENYLDKVPMELDGVVSYLLSECYDDDKLKAYKEMDLNDLFKEAIITYVNRYGYHLYLGELYAFSKYVELEYLISDSVIREFIEKVGFENVVRFDKEHNFVFEETGSSYSRTDIKETLFGTIAIHLSSKPEPIEVNSYEDFVKLVIYAVKDMKKTDGIKYANLFGAIGHELSSMCPEDFIDYEKANQLAAGLEKRDKENFFELINSALYGNIDSLLAIVKEYPQAVELLKGKKIDFSNALIVRLYNALGNDTFLNMIALYGKVMVNYLNTNDISFVDSAIQAIQNGVSFEDFMNEILYNKICSFEPRLFRVIDLPDSFKQRHPELYLPNDPNVPRDLVDSFYGTNYFGRISLLTPSSIKANPEWIPYIIRTDIVKCLEPITIQLLKGGPVEYSYSNINIYELLSRYMSSEEVLRFVADYSFALNDYNYNLELKEEDIQNNGIKVAIMNAVRRGILGRRLALNESSYPEEFRNANADLYMDDDIPEEIKNVFYQRRITPDMIKENPGWKKYLVNKRLEVCIANSAYYFVKNCIARGYTNEDILYLFEKYGRFVENNQISVRPKGEKGIKELEDSIKTVVISFIKSGKQDYDEGFKNIFGDEYPELFLAEDAPEELKNCFYHKPNFVLSFSELKKHREWIPYLVGKEVASSICKSGVSIGGLQKLFKLKGLEEGIAICIKNPTAVEQMLNGNNVDKLLTWYDRLHFIPHYVVMTTFPIEEIDKFQASGKLWSQIMRIEGHNKTNETVASMLKAAYAFGVFDGDREGFTKFIQLFTDIPRVIDEEVANLLIEKMSNVADIDEQKHNVELFESCYYKAPDGKYVLKIDPQQNRKEVGFMRGLMESVSFTLVLNADKAHQLFGGFGMIYDSDFRDFLLKNMDEILSSDEYISYMSAIQKQWKQIRVFNSNRVLTLEMAKDYVISNKYVNVQVGNEGLSVSATKAGYSQEEFDVLQQIYNIGKTRVASSIPRVSGQHEGYTYEILRLDDSLATAVGTLSDCCQEIGNAAQSCMEHSVVSEHGRVFVIRDAEGNIEAQSWVWRNKNVICFDNIEVPNKAFNRALERGLTRDQYTDQLLEIYKKAAIEMLEADEKMYKSLLEEGRITEEQYENLRARKVTAGEGYNDIKDSLIRNTSLDQSRLTRPLPYESPVIHQSLYTSDSASRQYIIAGEQDVPVSTEETLPVYDDEFEIYDKDTITEKVLLTLNKLEIGSRGNVYLQTIVYDKNNIMYNLAENYDLDPNTTCVIMNANFAIIYCVRDGKIVLGDIIANTKVQEKDITDVVVYQISVALKQIKAGMEFEIGLLDDEPKELFTKATGIKERGFTNGTV